MTNEMRKVISQVEALLAQGTGSQIRKDGEELTTRDQEEEKLMLLYGKNEFLPYIDAMRAKDGSCHGRDRS